MKHLSFLALVQDDLEQVETLLRERPAGQHEATSAAVEHLIGGGGKRLRPALVLLSARICGAAREKTLFAAAAVEMLHTATLIHDDLIDGSLLRRGMETLNARWSPGATVLTGDYVFAHAAYLVSQADSIRLMGRFAETLMVICNGEIRQMFREQPARIARQEYEQRIYAKTGSLIGLSAEAGAILGDASEQETQALRTYGERLGLAFQVVDDVLDFVADEERLGKPVGSDLRQGLLTLPMLLFLEMEPNHPLAKRVTAPPIPSSIVTAAVQAVAASPAIDQALDVARDYSEQAVAALDNLPPSPYRVALSDLAEFTVRRQF